MRADLDEKIVVDRLTADIVTGSVEQVLSLMTERRFRHVPILSDGKLVSIGDHAKSQLEHAKHTVTQLTNYVAGTAA